MLETYKLIKQTDISNDRVHGLVNQEVLEDRDVLKEKEEEEEEAAADKEVMSKELMEEEVVTPEVGAAADGGGAWLLQALDGQIIE